MLNKKMKFKDWHGKEHELPEGRTSKWRPSASALIIKDEKVLMVKSKQHKKWELPGGGVELGEMVGEGLKREVFEETGYEIEIKNNKIIHFENTLFYAPDVDEYFETIIMFFEAELKNEEQKKDHIDFDHEIQEIKWISINELENYEIKDMSKKAISQIIVSKKDSS